LSFFCVLRFLGAGGGGGGGEEDADGEKQFVEMADDKKRVREGDAD
jgi:hypothetical protein